MRIADSHCCTAETNNTGKQLSSNLKNYKFFLIFKKVPCKEANIIEIT